VRESSILQYVSKNLLSHASLYGLGAYAVTESLELFNVDFANPLVFLGGHDHCNIPVLAADEDGFALGGIEKGGEALLGVGSRDSSHLSILDNLDNSRQEIVVTRTSCYTNFVSAPARLRNVTVTLEEEVAQWARIEAARRDTSVSRLLGELLKERMGKLAGRSPVPEAAERAATFGKRHKLSLQGLKIKDLINEGRR
jgi:hypothetical protein